MNSLSTTNRLLFLLLDLICLNFAIALISDTTGYGDYRVILYCYLYGSLSWIITCLVFSRESLFLQNSFIKKILRITIRAIIFLGVVTVITLLFELNPSSLEFLFKYTGLFYIEQLILYFLAYAYIKYKRSKGADFNRVIIVGKDETCIFLRRTIESNPFFGYHFIGFVTSDSSDEKDVLGSPENLEEIIRNYNIQMIFVSLPLFSEERSENKYIKICNKLSVRCRFVPENHNGIKLRGHLESFVDLALVNPVEIPMDDVVARMSKRLFDLFLSSICIIFLFSWSFPIIALLIKLSSKGPVFFVQKRTGINNKPFSLIKFRSMEVNELADIKQASIDDPRTTFVGRLLRRTNIDELPQFFNVFMGNMSVIGPRPHMLKHTEEYSQIIDQFLIRHYVKPGISGWAQVNGLRGETNELWKMEKRVEYDLEYIKNWSFWWDIHIMWCTFFDLRALDNVKEGKNEN